MAVACALITVTAKPTKRGLLETVTPMEIVDALIFAIARDIDINKMITENDLRVWKHCCLCVPFIFKKIESEDQKHFEAFNARDAVLHSAKNLAHTAVQKIAGLMSFHDRKAQTCGKLSPKQLAKLYEDHAKYASGSEAFTETYVVAAMAVWNNLLTVPHARDVVMELEEMFGIESPLDSAYTMHAFVTKTKSLEVLVWCLHGLKDILLAGLVQHKELTNRALTGKNIGGRGVIDLLMFNREVGDYLVSRWSEEQKIDFATKGILRRVPGRSTWEFKS